MLFILGDKMVSNFTPPLKLPKGRKTGFSVLGKMTSISPPPTENLTQNFPLQHHAFLYKGLFCERPTRPETRSLVILHSPKVTGPKTQGTTFVVKSI